MAGAEQSIAESRERHVWRSPPGVDAHTSGDLAHNVFTRKAEPAHYLMPTHTPASGRTVLTITCDHTKCSHVQP
jgi:hypothetical protein